jgi:hypothetical protein
MSSRVASTIISAALLLSLVAAHGEEHMDMKAHETTLPPPEDDGKPRSYWSLYEHVALLYWHIGLEVLAWVVILPVGKQLSSGLRRMMLTFVSRHAEHRALAIHTAVAASIPSHQRVCASPWPRLHQQDS